jgi:hypothetical protein
MVKALFVRILIVFYCTVSCSLVLSMSQESRDRIYPLLRQESLNDESKAGTWITSSVWESPSMINKLTKQDKLVLAQELHKIYSEQGRDKFLSFLQSKKADMSDCVFAIERDMFLVNSLLGKVGRFSQILSGSLGIGAMSLALNLSNTAYTYLLQGSSGKAFAAAAAGGYLALQGFGVFKDLKAVRPVKNVLHQRLDHDQDMLDLLNQGLSKIKLKDHNPWWLE